MVDISNPTHFQDCDSKIQEVYNEIEELRVRKKIVTDPESLELLEQEIDQLSNRLGSLLLEEQLQNSLDSEEFKEREQEFIKGFPKRLKSEGQEQVKIQTSLGFVIVLFAGYHRRNCDRKKGKRYAGVYAGLALLGIHNRCTPKLASEIGILTALIGSLKETQKVLESTIGIQLTVNRIRKLAYSYAQRARVVQQMGKIPLGETCAGHRVVVSLDGGRIRLRENKEVLKHQKDEHVIRPLGVNQSF